MKRRIFLQLSLGTAFVPMLSKLRVKPEKKIDIAKKIDITEKGWHSSMPSSSDINGSPYYTTKETETVVDSDGVRRTIYKIRRRA